MYEASWRAVTSSKRLRFHRITEKSSSRKQSITLFAAVRVEEEGPGVGGLDMKDPDPLLGLVGAG